MNIDAKPYQFCGEWTTNVLVSRLSKALHREAIPHVLWGEYALTLYGVPGMPRVSAPACLRSHTAHHKELDHSRGMTPSEDQITYLT